MNVYRCKGLITLCVVSVAFFILPPVFHFTSRFSFYLAVFPCGFPRALDTNMLVSKRQVKTQEKCKKNAKKNPKREPNARKCFYILLCVGQKRESVSFCLRFASFLLWFCLQTLPKRKPNAKCNMGIKTSEGF